MPHIKFSYRYRDSANYKKFDFVIFENCMGVDLFELETLIKSKLIDGECFYATEWSLPEFFTEYVDFSVDPTWHEFERVAYTDEPANTLLALADFMERIEKANKIV